MDTELPTPGPALPAADAAPDWATTSAEVVCPMCGYNLRGLTSPRCAECGYALAVSMQSGSGAGD